MSNHSITYSTELMQNYLQAEDMAPEQKFRALQAGDGTSLLFSIGSDGVFYLTREMPGSRSGWQRSDVSSSQIATDFGTDPAGVPLATCKDFAVAQSNTGLPAIDLAMVVTGPQHDQLYLSLANSDADTSWAAHPGWVGYPFDDPAHRLAQVKIVRVEISDAADGEYIVVDVLRDPSGPAALVRRYYIDVKSADHAWRPHDVAIDLEAGAYVSCLGRSAGEDVDGIYTAGRVAGSAQFVYQPLYDPFGSNVLPPPARLRLPGGVAPEAIASCRNADDTSDLYASADGTLYCFTSENQEDHAVGVELVRSPRLAYVRALFAAVYGGKVMVWGLNGAGEVFYTVGERPGAGPSSWSFPLPILSGAEQVSPYVDRANSANTFFAYTGQDQLTKAVKSPDTSMWTFRGIVLDPPERTSPARRFSSYTTRVQVTGSDGQPAGAATVGVSASNVTSVYINYLYRVIGPTPIQVAADELGIVTIVEPVRSVAGTRLTVEVYGSQVSINPMEHAFHRAAALTTPQQLRNARVSCPDGSTKPLVPAGTSDADLHSVASGNRQLSRAYAAVAPTSVAPPSPGRAVDGTVLAATPALAAGGPVSLQLPSFGGDVESVLVDAGDLFSWLGHQIVEGVEHVVRLIEDGATGLWTFVATVANETYHCVLDCVEKVVGAVEWLYSVIKTAVADLIRYLEFLFEWADIRRTKEVVKGLATAFVADQLARADELRLEFGGMVDELAAAVGHWSGERDWAALGDHAHATPNGMSTPSASHSAPGSLIAHHFQGNVRRSTQAAPVQRVDTPPDLLDALVQAIGRESDAIDHAIKQLRAVAEDVGTVPLAQTLSRLVGLIGELGLESTKEIFDILFAIVENAAQTVMAVLDTPIHIPVVSDILKEIGVPSFSLLDIACWIVAVPVTIGYKIVVGSAPFPDNAETRRLIDAPKYAAPRTAFTAPRGIHAAGNPGLPMIASVAAAAAQPPLVKGARQPDTVAVGPLELSLSPGMARAVHEVGHGAAGLMYLLSAVLASCEAAEEDPDNAYSTPAAIVAFLGAAFGGVANVLVAHEPIKDPTADWVNKATTGVRVAAKIYFLKSVQSRLARSTRLSGLAVPDRRGVASLVDAACVVPALVCTCWHFRELSELPASTSRSIAIVEEVSSLLCYFARISYAVAIHTEAEAKAAAIIVMAGADVCAGGLQIAESAMGRSA